MCSGGAECPEESQKQSEHSPGVIEDIENLARIVVAPEHIDMDTGELKPGAFPVKDLKDRGLSLVRLLHAKQDQVEARAAELANGQRERTVEGLGISEAREIRSLRDDESRQALCVLDDGEEDFPAHAIAIRSADQSDPSLRKLRGDLIGLFMPIVSIDAAYS